MWNFFGHKLLTCSFVHLSAVMSRLYKLFENHKKVYSKIKFEEKLQKIKFWKKPRENYKNGKITEKYDKKWNGWKTKVG